MKPHQRSRLISLFADDEYRHEFFDGNVGTSIAAQIRANRLDRGWSQQELAEVADMKQSRISAMEDVNYQRWTIKTLKRLAKAFDLVLSVRFESFGRALANFEAFQDNLVQPPFARDPLIGLEMKTPDNIVRHPAALEVDSTLTIDSTPTVLPLGDLPWTEALAQAGSASS